MNGQHVLPHAVVGSKLELLTAFKSTDAKARKLCYILRIDARVYLQSRRDIVELTTVLQSGMQVNGPGCVASLHMYRYIEDRDQYNRKFIVDIASIFVQHRGEFVFKTMVEPACNGLAKF